MTLLIELILKFIVGGLLMWSSKRFAEHGEDILGSTRPEDRSPSSVFIGYVTLLFGLGGVVFGSFVFGLGAFGLIFIATGALFN